LFEAVPTLFSFFSSFAKTFSWGQISLLVSVPNCSHGSSFSFFPTGTPSLRLFSFSLAVFLFTGLGSCCMSRLARVLLFSFLLVPSSRASNSFLVRPLSLLARREELTPDSPWVERSQAPLHQRVGRREFFLFLLSTPTVFFRCTLFFLLFWSVFSFLVGCLAGDLTSCEFVSPGRRRRLSLCFSFLIRLSPSTFC